MTEGDTMKRSARVGIWAPYQRFAGTMLAVFLGKSDDDGDQRTKQDDSVVGGGGRRAARAIISVSASTSQAKKILSVILHVIRMV
jgi:hypothetical protein